MFFCRNFVKIYFLLVFSKKGEILKLIEIFKNYKPYVKFFQLYELPKGA